MSADANSKMPDSMDLESLRTKLVEAMASDSGRASRNCRTRKSIANSSKTNSRRIPNSYGWNQPPGNAETCGGFGGAGWIERLHEIANRKNRSLRETARGNYSRTAVVLRHFHALAASQRACWSKATWAADENRRKSRAPGQSGRNGRLRTGLCADAYDPDRSQT